MIAHNKQSNCNRYTKIGYVKFDKLCSYLKRDTSFYNNLIRSSNLPSQEMFECPSFPAGKCQLTNYFIEEERLLPQYIPGSENWRMDFRFKKKNVVIGGLNAYVVIKKNGLNGIY